MSGGCGVGVVLVDGYGCHCVLMVACHHCNGGFEMTPVVVNTMIAEKSEEEIVN